MEQTLAAVGAPVEPTVRRLVEKLRDAASQAGHYGAWSGGVLLEQAADEIERLDTERLQIAARIREAWHQREASHGNRGGEYHEGMLAGLDAAVALALGPNQTAKRRPLVDVRLSARLGHGAKH